jgi:ubiquinone/menaquinone biosynthesis C-methylase UbiE
MIKLAGETSTSFPNVEFHVASAERLPFNDDEFSHVFSMESLYYYADMGGALREIKRVLRPGGQFATVVDLYQENLPSHQWIDQLKVPVQLLSSAQYVSLFESAGFQNVIARRLYDPAPIPAEYSGGSFKTHEDYVNYKQSGSLMVSGEA